MPRGLQKKSAASRLLNELIVTIDDLGDYQYHPSEILYAGGLDGYRERKAWRKERERRRALAQLERLNYLTIRRRGDRVFIRLTDEGFSHALKQAIATRRTRLPDGQICYVSFDIPQHVRHLRTLLRSVLKEAKFKMVHQSLWATSKDIGKEFALLVKRLKAEDWIHVAIGRPLTDANL